jgi:hypothetical protein
VSAAMHILAIGSYIVIGIVSYSLLVVFLGRFSGFGNRKDHFHLEVASQLDSYFHINQGNSDQRQSDCPALSQILGIAASAGSVRAGTTLILSNPPHGALILELETGRSADAVFELVSYELQCIQGHVYREAQITFEVFRKGSEFHLKAIQCPASAPPYFSAFSALRSEDIIKKGYVAVARSRWTRIEAA